LVGSSIVKIFQAIRAAIPNPFRQNTGVNPPSEIIFLSIRWNMMDIVLNESMPTDRTGSRFQYSKDGFLET